MKKEDTLRKNPLYLPFYNKPDKWTAGQGKDKKEIKTKTLTHNQLQGYKYCNKNKPKNPEKLHTLMFRLPGKKYDFKQIF